MKSLIIIFLDSNLWTFKKKSKYKFGQQIYKELKKKNKINATRLRKQNSKWQHFAGIFTFALFSLFSRQLSFEARELEAKRENWAADSSGCNRLISRKFLADAKLEVCWFTAPSMHFTKVNKVSQFFYLIFQ